MQSKVVRSLVLVGTLALAANVLQADPPMRANLSIITDLIADANGNPPSSPSTPLYNIGGLAGVCMTLPPITAPDGHQVTLAEWMQMQGQAAVKCLNAGTHAVIQVSGLIPNGVYSVWVGVFKSPGFDGTLNNLIGIGALGSPDGTQNTFTASSDGTAALSAFHPGGNLSAFGTVGSCLTDQYEFQLIGAYHIDGQTHGSLPGPSCNYLEAFQFDFKP